MTSAVSPPRHDPLSAAARALRQHHHVRNRPPRAIPAWVCLHALPDWLSRVRKACFDAPPEATKAAEWFLDNQYQIQRAIRQLHADMPAAFFRQLPRLANPEFRGTPRAYHLAHGMLEATHLQLSLAAAIQFVKAYEEEAPLTIAELWAFPAMLRLACLELLVSALTRIFPQQKAPFRNKGGAAAESLDDTECVARALGGLQTIASIPWKEFFEHTSHVELALRSDPAGIYPQMDFQSRDRYRRSVEELSRCTDIPELVVTRRILAKASRAHGEPRRGHVGHWLIGSGRQEIELELGYRPRLAIAARRWLLGKAAGPGYASALILAALAGLAVPALYLWAQGAPSWALIAGIVLTIIPASILSITFVHWLATLIVPPRTLPKLDFSERIPASCPTAVVIPVIIRNPAEVPPLIERLELHRVANPDPALRFVLLSDHADAKEENGPGDSAVEAALAEGIRRLNMRHGGGKAAPFHWLHRTRQWNPGEGCWMGWERKRGKLEQFNRFVLGEETEAFPLSEGNNNALREVRFVLTVDADTTLPPGTVNRLVATLAHPLNTAEFDPETGQVCAGFTVIQPRVEISPDSGSRSLFSRLYTGDTTIDIYSRAVSDVYQDLFGSAIFVGKGIYDVEAFQRSLDARIPESALLSHDLFEGAHGRVALASDIVLYDDFPSGYLEYVHRWHRWIRGDWQLLPWLSGSVPAAGSTYTVNRLSLLERWKILDNLRRSLVPLALLALAVAGWSFLPGSPWVWTTLAIAAPGAHLFFGLISGLAHGRRRGSVRGKFRQLRNHCGRWLLALIFLVHDALVALDAIARTLWRLFVTRMHLLQWTSAAHTAVRFNSGKPRAAAWREMWPASAISAAIAAALGSLDPVVLLPAGPLLVLWILSPEIAIWAGRPRVRSKKPLGAEKKRFLRRVARRTWLYFETFAGPEDNWLSPDNIQEDPHTRIAHRTSPTNIGMQFLSALTAWDFGYLGPSELAIRIRQSLDTLGRLERYRGHFLNWYDTRTLVPLEPRYVSTVDSGNLAVCLVTLQQGCLEAADSPPFSACQWDGLNDALDLLSDALRSIANDPAGTASCLESVARTVSTLRDRPEDWHPGLIRLTDHLWPEAEAMIARLIDPVEVAPAAGLREARIWLERVNHHLNELRNRFDSLCPWLELVQAPPKVLAHVARQISDFLEPCMPLCEAGARAERAIEILSGEIRNHADENEAVSWINCLIAAIKQGARAQEELRQRLLGNASRSGCLASAMDFTLLYDREVRLFHIGYNISSDRIDPHHYDLLATEARLASYFAIAKGDVPTEHWFVLGRPIAWLGGQFALLSWNGSMFEYLLPPLLLPTPEETILERSQQSVVDTQRRYAAALGIPWGISESAFAARDSHQNYQYQAFGVPGIGLRRGLSSELVIAPYATALALTVDPHAATRNLQGLAALGLVGQYGFLEAADFTPERTGAGRTFLPVYAYMAHHQGMILASIGNALDGDNLVRRFSADLHMRAMELLLQERIPWETPPEDVGIEEAPDTEHQSAKLPNLVPWIAHAAEEVPQVQMLGNGRFASWISKSGGGVLQWHRHALTRWLPDSTCDRHGLWVYVFDEESGALWSAGRQPTGAEPGDARVIFHPHMVEFHRRDDGIATRMEMGVVSRDDLEIRRITIVNETDRVRTLLITSYGEVALAPAAEDERHPAFSKLFVGSEYVKPLSGTLFTRRPRSPVEQSPALLHRVVSDDLGSVITGFETDRGRFLDRNADARHPRGAIGALSNTEGWTLDPVMAIQVRLRLEPHAAHQFAFLTMAAGSRETVFELAERYLTMASVDWALNEAGRDAAHELQQLELEPEQLPRIQLLGSLVLHPQKALRTPSAALTANRLGQTRLWALGISGDDPILTIRIHDTGEMDLLRILIKAHQYWRRRLFHVDLVILHMGMSGYEVPMRERVHALIREVGAHELLGRRGGIHPLFADQINADDRRVLEVMSNVILDETRGPLERQLEAAFDVHSGPPPFEVTALHSPAGTTPLSRPLNLQFDNDIGGFSADGREYVIHLEAGQHTPAPWCNILANEDFGCLVTEAGGGFTWARNSGENRLTPWTNDPVCDPPGEILYLRDEETAEIWTPTPAPSGAAAPCRIHHGAGYSKWLKRSQGLEQELTIFVPRDDSVKVIRLRLRNLDSRGRRITATYYAEWLLGAMRSISRSRVVCEYDATLQALLARNPWNPEFADHVAFLTSSHPPHSLTTNRADFLGRDGNLHRPEGLTCWDLGGQIEAGHDPCAAFQVHLNIAAKDTVEVSFILGQGRDRSHAEKLVGRWRMPAQVNEAFEHIRVYWNQRLGAVRVRTPDPAFDMLINRWLLYQTLSSRILARAGFYQAGGAIGFRDQLQDVLALLHTDPARVRAHILDSAARQFEEGDVLHWWHPPQGHGVRTRCSDDLLWLPYVAGRYVEATGDISILEEEVPFLQAPALSPAEEDRYNLFEASPHSRPLFEHCARALERGVTRGPHELPLIASGDWNDGMNRVGREGRGESIWLGWFAIAVINGFVDMAIRLGRHDDAERWKQRAAGLRKDVDRAGWDGGWYLRAFDDEGQAWGSAGNRECRIDSISQSWAVLAGGVPSEHARTAVTSAVGELVREGDRLIRLLWPPFHKTLRDPGYIKAYPPGIRENGGQYTHAAAWLGLALAGLRDGEGAKRIFDIINPVRRTASRADAEHYRVEPYVLAADVAGVAPHTGRGGWTWYTGAAAWTWRLGVEAILGVTRRNGEVVIDPCLPPNWGSAEVELSGPGGKLEIRIEDPEHLGHGAVEITIDGVAFEGVAIAIPDDGSVRKVRARLRRK